MASSTERKFEPWQDKFNSTVSALKYMWDTEFMVDISLGHDRFAHRLVLSLWSPELADLLMTPDSRIGKISLSEDPEILKFVLEYLYCSESRKTIPPMPFVKLVKIFEVADRYCLKDLRSKCISSLPKLQITSANVMDFLDFGLRNDFRKMLGRCDEIIGNYGIDADFLKPDVSPESVIRLLNLRKIAMDSESKLLRLAISWLTHGRNAPYRSEVLRLLDLSSIDWAQYQSVVKDFPTFFSEPELSKILLCVALQKNSELSECFRTRTTTIVRRNCSTCEHVEKSLIEMAEFNWAKANFKDDMTEKVYCDFSFVFRKTESTRLIGIELNFGPKDIPSDSFEIALQVSPFRHTVSYPTRSVHVDYVQRGRDRKYVIHPWRPMELKTDQRLTLTFTFLRVLKRQCMKLTPAKDLNRLHNKHPIPRVKILSDLPVYFPESTKPVFVISSFHFRVCKNHELFLERTISASCHESTSLTCPSQPAGKRFKSSPKYEEDFP